MKIRSDFVTNSSSSAYICLRVDYDLQETILTANGVTSEQLLEKAYDEGLDEVGLKGENMVAAVGECYIKYVGRTLYESDLESKTLTQLKEEVAQAIKDAYGIQLNAQDIEFDYGEIER